MVYNILLHELSLLQCAQQTRIFGTRGQLEGDGSDEIKVYDFVTRETTVINPSKEFDSNDLVKSGHGGGDYELMRSFLNALVTGDDRYIISGAKETFGNVIIMNYFSFIKLCSL